MKEPNRIKLSPETPTTKEPPKYRLAPKSNSEIDISGQDNDDIYRPVDLDKINKLLDESNEDNSQDN